MPPTDKDRDAKSRNVRNRDVTTRDVIGRDVRSRDARIRDERRWAALAALAPGTMLRDGLERILRGNTGALIVYALR